MSGKFSARELFLLIAGLAVLLIGSWGLVVWLTVPSPGSNDQAAWELTVKRLIRGQLETALNATEIRKPVTTKALATIAKRLDDGLRSPLPYPVEIVVADLPEINAFTFPGGLIVVSRSLLLHAKDPEEVAAVLAHEMGHVAYHDSANSLKSGLLLASLAVLTNNQGAVDELIQTVTKNAFARSVEDRADEFAFEVLTRAKIRPSRLADFLASLPESPQGKFVQKNLPYLLDHPAQQQRIQKARQAPFTGNEDSIPVDWAAVKEELASR